MRILITGITGSLGAEVTKQLLKKYPKAKIFGFSRCEQRQQAFMKHKNITLILGDIRDRARITEACRDVDIIFHFAALKHVDVLEKNPEEAYKTNVLGTDNVLHAQRMNKVPRVVLSSTDKACEPVNVYGCTKRIAEGLVSRNKNNVVARYGNVVASNGSVIPSFIRTIQKENKIYLTHPNMSRFLIRLPDAAAFIIHHAFSKKGGKFIPEMKACLVSELAEAVGEVIGIRKFETVITGMRPGEKLAEALISRHESGKALTSSTCEQFTKKELIKLIEPSVRALR